jgi:hypothetical protein
LASATVATTPSWGWAETAQQGGDAIAVWMDQAYGFEGTGAHFSLARVGIGP